MAKQAVVTEYGSITVEHIAKELDLQEKKAKKAFEELKTFASYEQNWQFLRLNKGGKELKAQNYVGVIQTKSGVVVEILPKIHDIDSDDDTRDILVRMLSALKYEKYKQLDFANLKTSPNMPLLELFISMFVGEVAALVQKGIRSDYIQKEENSAFLKGKLLFGEHIKQNLVHKERFFVSYDEYLPNRAENRLIKETLSILLKKSKNAKNQQRLREYLFVFDEIEASKDYKADFARCKNDRNMKYYERSLAWCKVFLTNEVFTPHKGDSVAFALLFPMEKVFEDYVVHGLKKICPSLKTQHRERHLIESHKLFKLKPDLYFEEQKIVADTKWKLADDKEAKMGATQADLYQLYAYGKKYEDASLAIIYPKNAGFDKSHTEWAYYESGKLSIKLLCFELTSDKKQEKTNFENLQKEIYREPNRSP